MPSSNIRARHLPTALLLWVTRARRRSLVWTLVVPIGSPVGGGSTDRTASLRSVWIIHSPPPPGQERMKREQGSENASPDDDEEVKESRAIRPALRRMVALRAVG